MLEWIILIEPEYVAGLVTLAAIKLLAVMSPGPDFAIVVRHSLQSSRQVGLSTALGISVGVTFHIFYIMIGVGNIILQTPWMLYMLKGIGCSYLCYIGWQGVCAKGIEAPAAPIEVPSYNVVAAISPWQGFKRGFLTNALNPKAALFFLSIITGFITPEMPTSVKILYGAEMILIPLIWFAALAVFFTTPHIQRIFTRHRHHLDRLMGLLLIGLAIKLALT